MTSWNYREDMLSAPASPAWLLRSSGPVSVRSPHAPGRTETQRQLSCTCGRESDWLIIADPQRVMFVCRCGRRTTHAGLLLEDVVALVEAEPMRPHWRSVDDAIRALGFAPGARGPSLHITLPYPHIRLRRTVPGGSRH
jgi:hypothetical protein